MPRAWQASAFTSSLPIVLRPFTRPGRGACRFVRDGDCTSRGDSAVRGLDDVDLAAIASAASEVEAAEGQSLAAEGDFGHALYAIESGTADVTRRRHASWRTLGPGDVFGEIAVLASGPANGVGRRDLADAADRALQARLSGRSSSRSPEAAERLRALIAERRSADSIARSRSRCRGARRRCCRRGRGRVRGRRPQRGTRRGRAPRGRRRSPRAPSRCAGCRAAARSRRRTPAPSRA